MVIALANRKLVIGEQRRLRIRWRACAMNNSVNGDQEIVNMSIEY